MFSVQLWMLLDGRALTIAFVGLDTALAAAFLNMSRGRWFPVPLFFLYAFVMLFYLYSLIVEQSAFWMAACVNRTFDAAVAYVAACSWYRIRRRRLSQTATFKARE
ncbi:MAG: hypothetical protein AAGD92_12680 [Pseudomonadota bacterium]